VLGTRFASHASGWRSASDALQVCKDLFAMRSSYWKHVFHQEALYTGFPTMLVRMMKDLLIPQQHLENGFENLALGFKKTPAPNNTSYGSYLDYQRNGA
jgi:hypothetical protein